MSSRKRRASDSASVTPRKSQRHSLSTSLRLSSTKPESLERRHDTRQSETDEITPRTLVQNFVATHATAETTRKRQRIENSPTGQSPRRRSSRLDTTLRKKALMQNVLESDTDGPTPRSLIQGLIAKAPPETPVVGTTITQRTVQADSFILENSEETPRDHESGDDSFLVPYRYPLRDRASILKSKKLERSAAHPGKLSSGQDSAHSSPGKSSAQRRSPRLNAGVSPSTALRRKVLTERFMKESREDPTPRSMIQALVIHAPDETLVVGTELTERNIQRMGSSPDLNSDDYRLDESTPVSFYNSDKPGSTDQTLIQNNNKQHREHVIRVDVEKFATSIKEHIARSGVNNAVIEETETLTTEIHEPVHKLQTTSPDLAEKSVRSLAETAPNYFDAEVRETREKNTHSPSREDREQLPTLQNEEDLYPGLPPRSEQKQTDNSSDKKMFSDEDEEGASSETELEESEATHFHIPEGMKQMKITDLLNSVALTAELERPIVQMSFNNLALAEFCHPEKSMQAQKKHQQKSSRARKPKSKDVPIRLPRSLTKSIVQHFSQRHRISNEVLDEIEKVSDKFWKYVTSDLSAYAAHAKRKFIKVKDVELLMKRQRFITPEQSLFSLVEEYLPLEYRQEIIPIARAGNIVVPDD